MAHSSVAHTPCLFATVRMQNTYPDHVHVYGENVLFVPTWIWISRGDVDTQTRSGQSSELWLRQEEKQNIYRTVRWDATGSNFNKAKTTTNPSALSLFFVSIIYKSMCTGKFKYSRFPPFRG